MRGYRALLSVVCLLMAWLLVVVPATPGDTEPVPPPALAQNEIRGVWLTGNDMGTLRSRPRLQAALGELSRLNFNTIYPVVWNGGYAYHTSAVTRQRKIQSFSFKGLEGQDLLADVIKEGHERGLLVIPWFEFGFMAPPFSELALQHPAWLTKKRDGGKTSISAAGEVVWLNPFHPEVQAFITELVLEITSQYDGDGIQFDDHMSLPRSFGYDDYTVALYTKETKKAPPANPEDPAWVKWRADKITTFMTSLHKAVKAAKPKAIISVSPNYYDFAYKLQLQDWLEWVRRGIADEVIVQLYRPDLPSFASELNRPELQESKQKIPTAVGIMSGQRTSTVPIQRIKDQVRATHQRGLGVAFFYFESLWEHTDEPVEVRKASLKALFPIPARRWRR